LKGFEGLSFTAAGQDDYKLLIDMEKKCFSPFDIFKPHQVRRFLSNPAGSIITDIIVLDNNPIGWAAYFTRSNSRLIRLYSICIVPEFGGHGYAREYMKLRFTSLGKFKAMTLEVRKSNLRAINLYEGLGFTGWKSLPGYYPDDEDGIRMIKALA
jgi:ribosomal protein S18 acetylase RimI-like enzyme